MIDISQNIRNVCRKKMVVPAFLTMAMIIIIIACPFINIFHPVNRDNIYDVKESDSYINVTADTLHYSGYNLITFGNSQYSYYYALKDNLCIFTIIPTDANPESVLYNYSFRAKVIKPNKSYNKMLTAFAKDLNWNEKDLANVSETFVLSNADYHPVLYMVLFWIVLIILFISIKNLSEAIIGFVNPSFYPVCTFLGKNAQKALIDDATAELGSENYLQINSMYITENYFIDFGKKKVSIIPLKEIVWCYRLGTISLNPKKEDPEYSLHFTILSGSSITAKHKTSDEALEAINAIRATEYDIIIGHSESKRKRAKRIIAEYNK